MKRVIVLGALLATPMFVFAQATPGSTPLEQFIRVIANVVASLLPIVATLALVFFFYGLAKYILNAGDEEKKAEGKNIMIWGVLALFVMVTLWGIIGFIQQTVGANVVPKTGTFNPTNPIPPKVTIPPATR